MKKIVGILLTVLFTMSVLGGCEVLKVKTPPGQGKKESKKVPPGQAKKENGNIPPGHDKK